MIFFSFFKKKFPTQHFIQCTLHQLDVIYYDCKRESTYTTFSTIHTYYMILHISHLHI